MISPVSPKELSNLNVSAGRHRHLSYGLVRPATAPANCLSIQIPAVSDIYPPSIDLSMS